MTRTAALALLLSGLAAYGDGAARAQRLPSPEEGAPHATRFGWGDYRGHTQNWAVAQSPRGLLYVANTWGVMEYDGAEWRLMPFGTDARTLVRSLAIGRSGRIYTGGIGELGWLEPDSTRTLGFRSLVHAIPARARDFSDVWSAHATDRGVVFQTPEYLFRWTGRRMQVWKASTSYHLAFLVDGRVYVREEGVGLRVLDGDRLRLVPGGRAFAERRVFALMPHPRGLLAAVRDEGLWTVGRRGAAPLDAPASRYVAEFRPYGGIALPAPHDGLYAVATFGGGVVVMDAAGRIVRVHREDVGLEPDDWLTGMALDRQGGLWLALLDGVVRLDLAPRLTEFGAREGLAGDVYSVERHGGTIYVGTSIGLFRLVPGRAGRPGEGPAYGRFEPVAAADGSDLSQTWSLLSTGGDLLVGGNGGLFRLRGERLTRLTEAKTLRLSPIAGRPDVLVGEKDGLRVLSRGAGGWSVGEPFAQVDGEIGSFGVAGRDTWIGLQDGRVVRVTAAGSGYRLAPFGPESGLAPGPATVVEWDGSIRVLQQAGVHRPVVEGARVRFEPDPALAHLDGEYSLFGGAGQRPWLYHDNVLSTLGAGRPFSMRLSWAQVETVNEETTGVVWVGTNNGLYRYDPRVSAPRRPFPAFVRRVTDSQRRPLYGGAPAVGVRAGAPALVLPHRLGSLRFEFAAAAFSRPEGTSYQYRLEGLDGAERWSPWSPERSTNYTQLFEGTYTFHVRGRDAYGRVGATASFTLRVLPPWYRTVWAYLAYVLLAGGGVWAFTAWRLHKLRVRAEAQRARNARLARIGERLREANARLRRAEQLKDDLLANTSHELRTPLTAIMGFSEMLLDEVADDDQRDLAERIHRGGARLLGTVNGLLDMYKLQSGTLDVYPEPLDAHAVARETVGLLAPLARARGLTLRVVPDGLAVPAVADRSVLERILTNLVGNALKFTETGGVDVLVDADADTLRIAVRDTGIGIPPEMTERVFEPFEQVSTGLARSHEGTGLGLAIVHRLVELVGGTVGIESALGVGTTVRVALPRAAAAPAARVAVGEENHALAGAHLFALDVPPGAVAVLAEWIGPAGRVLQADTAGRAARALRRTTCDAVLLGADTAECDARRVRQLRRVPGYAHTPMVRVGGEPLSGAELAARGFTHALALPLDVAVVVPTVEAILSRVESDEEAETLAP